MAGANPASGETRAVTDPDLQARRRSSALTLAEQAALLQARRRAGEIEEERLLLAAYAGDLPAQAVLGLPDRAESASLRATYTNKTLALRWSALRAERPDDPYVEGAYADPLLSRLSPAWVTQGLVLSATEPSVTGFLLEARSVSALRAGPPPERSPEEIAAALAGARAQVEAEGLSFVAEGDELTRDLLERGDWRAPRLAQVWLRGFGHWGEEVRVRAWLAYSAALLEAVARPRREAWREVWDEVAGYAACPCEEHRLNAVAAQTALMVRAGEPAGAESPEGQVASALSHALLLGQDSTWTGEEPELALLPEREAIQEALTSWALAAAD